ncbi:MAG: N-acetyltransferase [Acidimicrobiales bacterium]|nr:N-acetyltransferase [Acidimicrobiales bacterium]
MEPLPEGTTGYGVSLRVWTADDAPTLHDAIAANVEHLRPWMAWIAHEPLTVDQRRLLIEQWNETWAAGGDVIYGVWQDGVIVGGTGLHRRLGPSGLEIGYWVDVHHVGRGIATAAARAITDLAFTVDGTEVVEIHHDVANHASRRVPEKLGFVDAGTVVPRRELRAPAETGLDRIWRTTRRTWPPG